MVVVVLFCLFIFLIDFTIIMMVNKNLKGCLKTKKKNTMQIQNGSLGFIETLLLRLSSNDVCSTAYASRRFTQVC